MAKNEYGEKLDSNGYAPSILSKSPTCLICGRYRTARHEVFFGPYRDKSKRLGLWANLCPWCHQNGVTAVHTNREADLRLKKWAQKKAMEYYGWPEARFIHAYSGHSVSESALTVPWARRIAARFSFPPI